MSKPRTHLSNIIKSKHIFPAIIALMLAMASSYSHARWESISSSSTKPSKTYKYGDTRWISNNTGIPYGWAIIQKQSGNRLIKNLNGAKYPAKVTVTADSPYPSGWVLRPGSNNQTKSLIYIADAPSGAKVDIAKGAAYPNNWADLLLRGLGNNPVNYQTIRNLSGNAFSRGEGVIVTKSSNVPSGWKVVSGSSLSYKILEKI